MMKSTLLITFAGLLLFGVTPLTFAVTSTPEKSIAAEHTSEKKPDVLLMMSTHGAKPKAELLLVLAKDSPFTLKNYQSKGKTEEEIRQDWSTASLILLDGINPELSKFMFGKYQSYITDFPKVPVISLGDINNSAMNMGLTEQQKASIAGYYNNGGRGNYQNLMAYLAHDVFTLSAKIPLPPAVIPDVGLYHYAYPGQVTANEAVFFNWLAAKKTQAVIAIGIHRSVIDYEQQQVVDAMIKGLEQKGAKAFAFFFEGSDQLLDYTELLMTSTEEDVTGIISDIAKPEQRESLELIDPPEQSRVDLLINYRSLHYVKKRKAEFAKLRVPVIHALNYTEGDEAQFLADNAGISASLTPFFLVMPEDTGSVDPSIIAANDNGNQRVIPSHMDALIERAYHHARLSHIKNKDKKVATFIWNYPPGEKNIGAAFLDVPSSIAQISRAMKTQGYQVTVKEAEYFIKAAGQLLRPYYRGEDTRALVNKGLADYLPLKTYLAWFNQLPASVTTPIIARWGKPEDSAMLTSNMPDAKSSGKNNVSQQPAFIIPRMNLGNMIVLPQGIRGEDVKEHSALYHSTKTPVNHSYLAIYLYAREVFGADAFIHLGTHGSQEWLTGKERGLSVFDAPSLAVGNIPVFYPYIIDNVGEAMQAKRRGRATTISHLTPGFAKAGLYAQIAELNELIGNYLMLEQGLSKENTRTEITTTARTLNILTDIDITETQLAANFDTNISKIQDHLIELSEQSQPLGVHTFGLLPQQAHLLSTLIQMLGEGFAQRAAVFEQTHQLSLPLAERFDERKVKKLAALDGFQLLKRVLIDDVERNKSEASNKPITDIQALLDQVLKEDISLAKKYWQNFANIAELENLLRALEGHYIEVSFGGDPIRNPDAAPTGRNLIGFNPAKVPSKEAYQAGVTLMEQTIKDYVLKHGRYPEKLAFSLWSLETMRHQGALEAQILHALGLKPKWNQQGNVIDTQVIPYSELGRPRIDVVISATGLYRDAFPNVMLWLAKAIDNVAKMKEDNNFVYRHANVLKQTLLDEGKSLEDADYLSSVRIFSNETGNYGTGLAASSLASDTWETDDKLANLYLDRMGFSYGKDETRWSENVADAKLYRKVLSGTDAVIFSRSTNLYALMTNDDPFQYFGGIGLAVRHLDGETPDMYVANLRRKDKLKAQTMKDFLNQEMRSRYFHPRWIQAMQASGYAGATTILDRMNNMWGWEVMTPEAIRDDQWQEFFDVYVNDKYQLDMRAFFEANNAEALAQIVERMLEAVRKDYWQADEQTIKKMVQTYSELALEFDVATDNQSFSDYLDVKAKGFGLMPLSLALTQQQVSTTAKPLPTKVIASKAAAEASTKQLKQDKQLEQVTGQKLEQQQAENTQRDRDDRVLYLLLLIFFAGAIRQWFARPPKAALPRPVVLKAAA